MKKADTSGGIRKELEEVCHTWAEALTSNDVERIAPFMTDDWIIVSETGTTTKDAFFGFIKSGLLHDSFEIEINEIRVHNDCAIVIARVRNSGTYQGASFSSDEWATDFFIKQDGTWRCAISHITAVKNS